MRYRTTAAGGRGIPLVILLILVVSTGVLAAERLFAVEDTTPCSTIQLQAATLTQVSHADSGTTAETSTTAISNGSSVGTAGFTVSDENQQWSTETTIDLFHPSDTADDGTITVDGGDDKVVAPGTQSSYTFRLDNTGSVALDYQMTMEAYFGSDEYTIPVEVKLNDQQGSYLVGDQDSWTPVADLEEVGDSGILAAGCYTTYTLTWQWPYEGEDADQQDTALGDLATEEDLTLTVVLRAVATADENPDAVGGIPKTGDTTNLALWIALGVSACGALFILLLLLKNGENKGEKVREENV